MKLQAVIFDMDGTLLNTIRDMTNAINFAMSQYGHRHNFTDSEVKHFFGSGAEVAVLRALSYEKGVSLEKLNAIGRGVSMKEAGIDPLVHAEVLAAFADRYKNHCTEMTAPYPGIPELLNSLKEAGILAAVVSNKADHEVKHLASQYFHGLLAEAIGEQPEIKRKPAADMLLKCMKDLNVSSAVYAGDTEIDMETAANAGIPCISVSWGFRGHSQLEKVHAAYIADTVGQFQEILNSF